MNKPPPSARVLATIYNCSERSIRNYRAEGAPLHDPAAMFGWWATRKNLPKGAAAKGLDAIKEAFAAVVGTVPPAATASVVPEVGGTGMLDVPPDLPAGAQHELRWLEALAVEARHNLIRARGSADPVAMKQALDAYLKITEGLRKFDNQVTADRRDSGEVVTRVQVEDPITALTVWLRRGVENFLNGACLQIAEAEKPEEVYAAIADPLRQCLGAAVDAACGDGKFPLWMKHGSHRKNQHRRLSVHRRRGAHQGRGPRNGTVS